MAKNNSIFSVHRYSYSKLWWTTNSIKIRSSIEHFRVWILLLILRNNFSFNHDLKVGILIVLWRYRIISTISFWGSIRIQGEISTGSTFLSRTVPIRRKLSSIYAIWLNKIRTIRKYECVYASQGLKPFTYSSTRPYWSQDRIKSTIFR